ncbi:uncharacterized protein VP01_3223g4 [Puccinia sorghi]|uniref:UNC-45/Cro1/She4 central domain-containing protein n=1 Tax=Puccinia sorghi TaxID=27349 RepID=A0A0L6UY91_9BASI|nr:uncharacterized protein VP01_3223g4 [Puccinia sorghi]
MSSPKELLKEGGDQVQSIIDHPSREPSQQSLQRLLHDLSSQNQSIRAKAFSALAITIQSHQAKASQFFQAPLESLLQSTAIQEVCHGLAGLSAIFMLSPQDALAIIRVDGFLPRLAESVVDLLALGPTSKSKSKADLNHAFSEFIALSLNHKPVREMIKSDWPGCLDWLTRVSSATSSTVSIPARCAASLALIKLRLTNDLQDKNIELPSLAHLCLIMFNALLDNTFPPNIPIEGLALLSQHGAVREILMKESERLLKTVKALPVKKETNLEEAAGAMKSDTSIAYGVATILTHLTSYKPLKTEEDRAADQLKKLALRSGQAVSNDKLSGNVEDETEIGDELVFEWIQFSLKRNNDLMDTVGWLAKSESREVKRTTGKLLLNLVDRQACRGLVLQSGGGRMLMKIIATLTISPHNHTTKSPSSTGETATGPSSTTVSEPSFPTLDPSDLHIVQALAKILITTNPLLVFGPAPDSPVLLSTIKPLTTLFVHPDASLLQTFEALMALTNLSSLGGKIPAEIAGSRRVLNRLEECLIGVRTGENLMVRRAATELLCNLSSTQLVLDNFGAQAKKQSRASEASISRLHILIALCSSEDPPTALAAAGALAILNEKSPDISCVMVSEEKLYSSLSRIVVQFLQEQLEEDHSGLEEESEVEKGRLGVLYRLVHVLLHLSIFRDSHPRFFEPIIPDSLHSLSTMLQNQTSSKHKEFYDEFVGYLTITIRAIE